MLRKVMVIDDSPLVRELCKRALRGQTREIVQAESGCEAFEMLAQHPDTDLLLLDIHMPSVNGLAVLAALRETKEYRRVPVILLAQRGDEREIARGIALGAVTAVQKFDNLQTLPALIADEKASLAANAVC